MMNEQIRVDLLFDMLRTDLHGLNAAFSRHVAKGKIRTLAKRALV